MFQPKFPIKNRIEDYRSNEPEKPVKDNIYDNFQHLASHSSFTPQIQHYMPEPIYNEYFQKFKTERAEFINLKRNFDRETIRVKN